MGVIAEQYQQQLVALLPRGVLWEIVPQSFIDELLRALTLEFERVHLRAQLLIDEADVRTTNELLTDWERVTGLPDACTTLASTLEDRRNNLTIKLHSDKNQHTSFYINVAARLGYVITITEGKNIPYELNHLFNGVQITVAEWIFVWRVTAPATTVKWARAGSAVAGEPIQTWGNTTLECIINRLKPAHTHVLFSYV